VDWPCVLFLFLVLGKKTTCLQFLLHLLAVYIPFLAFDSVKHILILLMHGLIPKYLEFLIERGLVQPCNPAVGGPAKSQLVHEVDALGGEIGKIADR